MPALNVRFHPLAAAEMAEASVWLDGQSFGMGADFLYELRTATDRLADHPALGQLLLLPRVPAGMRRLVLHRFRYILVYRVVGADLWVEAVAHTSREPAYWLDRV